MGPKKLTFTQATILRKREKWKMESFCDGGSKGAGISRPKGQEKVEPLEGLEGTGDEE